VVIIMRCACRCLTPLQRKNLLESRKSELRAEYRVRIEIMLLADKGKSQSEIYSHLGCSQGTVRRWMCMAQIGRAYLWNVSPVGRPKKVSGTYTKRLKELVLQDPHEYGYSFKTWTASWLKKHLAGELGIEVTERHINRILKEMGLSARNKDGASEKAEMCELDVKNQHITIHDLVADTPSPPGRLESVEVFPSTAPFPSPSQIEQTSNQHHGDQEKLRGGTEQKRQVDYGAAILLRFYRSDLGG
jgi:transposase